MTSNQCYCGRFLTQLPSNTSVGNNSNGTMLMMDASFVQVPLAEKQQSHTVTRGEKYHVGKRGLASLQRIVTTTSRDDDDSCRPLCTLCIQKHERALQVDIERLERETQDYTQAARQERLRAKGLQQTIQRTATMLGSEASQEAVEEAFRNEIDMLTSACAMTREELTRLRRLLQDQASIGAQMEAVQLQVAEEQNTLALEARAFDDDQKQLSRILNDLREEEQRLSAVDLPLSMFRLSVDTERGLRYPLINDLRLAYRPKGDLTWNEISAAWALAAQMLLSIGTLFGFQSPNWRIVPLSHCAKIIYNPSDSRSKVFNLGHPKTNGPKALLTWNALLCQVIHHLHTHDHVSSSVGVDQKRQPYEISPTTIGTLSLTKLDATDDAGWGRAIHYMSSNLLWLSQVTSAFLRQHVTVSVDTPPQKTQESTAE